MRVCVNSSSKLQLLIATGILICPFACTNVTEQPSENISASESIEGEGATSVQQVQPGAFETVNGTARQMPQAATSAGVVTGFTLINSDTDQPIAGYTDLVDGSVIRLDELPTLRLNIRANVMPETVGSVRFAFDGFENFRTENFVPYALAGDRNGNYFNWTPFLGSHTLTATPFSESHANGVAGTSHTIQFEVESTALNGLAIESFTLIDADTNQPIPGFDPLADGAVVALAGLPSQNLSMRANVTPSVVGSVRFFENGQSVRVENVPPYTLGGDIQGNYRPWRYDLGEQVIAATPYTQSQGNGLPGESRSVNFTIVEELGCASDADCSDDMFCNGEETCDDGTCTAGETPCNESEICNEEQDRCDPEPECTQQVDCDDGMFCNGAELCVDGNCVDGPTPCNDQQVCNEQSDTCDAAPECTGDADCADGLFCNGVALCVDGVCVDGSSPCDADEFCNESADRCDECASDGDCDDGQFCTGSERCVGGSCVSAGDPCGETEQCDESNDECVAPSGPAVVSFTLIDAAADEPIADFDPLVDGAIVNFADLATNQISIRANTSPSSVGSVRFALDGNQNLQTENVVPYALNGDSGGNFNPWNGDLGEHTLTATPFTSNNGGGQAGMSLTINFTLIDQAGPVNDPPTANAGPDRDVPATTTSVTIEGSGSDTDGFIAGFAWSQTAGPDATLANADSADLDVSNLQVGVYVFALQVTDDDGATDTDQMTLTVGNPQSTGVVSGELRKWHRVTLTFDGPQASELGAVNPFTDYRLSVTFTNGSTTHTVPGFFAADGDAANTSAASGDQWRVHFAPDKIGTWTYVASFRTGPEVAVSLNANEGSPTAFDGASGSFTIAPTNKTGRDHRGKGLLQYVGEHFLQFAETGEYFIKGGADSPENMLGYFEFDNTFDNGGLATPGLIDGLHRFEPHVQDFQPGDPTWQNGKGRGFIGALNYLSGQGMNSVYFLTFNVAGGDGQDTWPWTDPEERNRFDCSKLDQWEIVFSHMDAVGIQLHVVTQETENDQNLDGGELELDRKLYYRELVARFGHHLALIWNLGEENSNTNAQRKAFADYIRALDTYGHPITVHTFNNAGPNYYSQLYGHPTFEATSLQGSGSSYNQWAIEIRERSEDAGRKWVVFGDEQGPRVDDDLNNLGVLRSQALWGNLLGGGAGVEWYFGYQGSFGDVQSEDWRIVEPLWEDTRHALRFFQQYVPFAAATPRNDLASAGSARCLTVVGDTYVVQLPAGGTTNLNLGSSNDTFTVRWFDPRNAGSLSTGTVDAITGPGSQPIGFAPNNINEDWVVLIRRQ